MKCCDEMGLMLSRYVDGELAPEEKAAVATHCEECADCRQMLDRFLRNDHIAADAFANMQFGDRILDGVLQKLDAETIPAEPARRDWIRWWPAAAAAAA